eukprot:SAG22_NODE_241_length_14126_cov_9.747202_1_plen_166_part_00
MFATYSLLNTCCMVRQAGKIAVSLANGEATVLSFKGSDHCLSLCFSAFPCGSTALTEDTCCNQGPSAPGRRRSGPAAPTPTPTPGGCSSSEGRLAAAAQVLGGGARTMGSRRAHDRGPAGGSLSAACSAPPPPCGCGPQVWEAELPATAVAGAGALCWVRQRSCF